MSKSDGQTVLDVLVYFRSSKGASVRSSRKKRLGLAIVRKKPRYTGWKLIREDDDDDGSKSVRKLFE